MSATPENDSPIPTPNRHWSSARCAWVFAAYLIFFAGLLSAGLMGIDVHPNRQIRAAMIVPDPLLGRVLRLPKGMTFISPPLELAVEVDRRIMLRIPLASVDGVYRLRGDAPIPPRARLFVICSPVSFYAQIRRGIAP